MNEGMRCDRISLMNAGKVLAADAPQKLIEARGAKTLEEAFIGYMEDAIGVSKAAAPGEEKIPPARRRRSRRPRTPSVPFSLTSRPLARLQRQ